MNGYTFSPRFTSNSAGFFGMVDVTIGTRIIDARVIRIARKTKQKALTDAARLAALMRESGPLCRVDLAEFG